jgi:peptidoglycan/xylan/chitin deacetylase (PgdA/CDA1 family)
MRPPRNPVPRAQEAWWWLGGLMTLGILGGGILVAGLALWENIDVRQLTPALAEAEAAAPMPVALAPATPAVGESAFNAVILRTEANRRYFEDPGYYETEVARWAGLVARATGTVREVTDAAGLRAVRSDEVLVLPEAPCLSSTELAAINAHLRRGGSVATNWAPGVRNGACEWRGWSPLLSLTGAEAVRELPPREALYMTLPGGLPISPGIDPGTRIGLRPDPSIALGLKGERAYWSDWALNPAPDESGAGMDVAVVTRTTDQGGRVAWFGPRSRQGATPVDSARLDRLFVNGLMWSAGVPMASPSHWPGAAQAAMLFALDVEGEDTYGNARDVASAFRADSLPITFFPVSRLVLADRELASDLAQAGEIGTQTVDHLPLAGRTPQDQALRLRRSWSEIEEWTGVAPSGLRPPEETFDMWTIRAWKQAGGAYILGSNEARSASPEIHTTVDGPLVLLPRLLKDDYDIVVRDVTMRASSLESAYQADARKMRAIGGLAVIAAHTQILSSEARIDALLSLGDTARAQGDWWITRADEVARWWVNRSHVDLAWDDDDVLVTIPSGYEVHGLWIDVVRDLGDETIPLVDDRSVDFLDEEWGMRVRVGSLLPGEVKRITFIDREGR